MHDLADARIRGSRIDEANARVTIDIEDAAGRKASLVFDGARSLDRVAESLKMAARPGGNLVLHWKPAAPGNTFLYLMDGVVSIWSQKLTVENE